MRSNPAMLYPLFALAAWTLVVLVLIPAARVGSVRLREVGTDGAKDREPAHVPGHVGVPNRSDMDLLELPMLFYVVAIVLYVSGGASYVAMFFAWAYVALRIVHGLIRPTGNRLIHRFSASTLSIVALVVLWVLAGVHLAGAWP
jgi:hypothetical protein